MKTDRFSHFEGPSVHRLVFETQSSGIRIEEEE